MENNRNTEQKKIIYNELVKAGHPTASQLYEIIHENNPTISRATVFRVLSQFAQSGRVRKLEFLGSDTRFDASTFPHAHCHCVSCGAVCDVSESSLSGLLNVHYINGYKVYSTEIEFNGLCPDCQRKNN
jgi:Fe2+ or Zn2+ uptake regulation protein